MFLLLKDVLSPAEVAQIRDIAGRVRFVDGRVSNPHNTAKNNLQADSAQPEANRASQIAGAAIARSAEFKDFAFPKRVAPPLLSRYEPGMTYGPHTDAPTMPMVPAPLRADVSATLFIAEPSSYDGGELTIHLGTERVVVKGEPGSMIVYPSSTIHEVLPVTRGARLAMFTFIESTVPNPVHRDLLYQLGEVHALEGLKMDWQNRTRIQHVMANLQRMWTM